MSKLIYRALSLLLAILLFMYVRGNHLGATRSSKFVTGHQNSILMSDKTVQVKVPVDLSINTSKYVVSGYPSFVRVDLTGPSAIVTTERNIRDFRVTLRLRRLKVGVHRVQFQIEGLNKEVNARIRPLYTTVKIAKRKTGIFNVQPEYNIDLIKDGYKALDPQFSVDKVAATGSVEDVNKIDHVVAEFDLPIGASTTTQRRAIIRAVDGNGKTVNVILNYRYDNVTLPIVKSDYDSKNPKNRSSDSKSN